MSFINAGRPVWEIMMGRIVNLPENLQQAVLDARSRNTNITERDLMFELGKKRQLQVSFYPPVCNDEGTCSDNVCGEGVKQEMVQRQYELTQCTASDVYILNKSDIRLVDASWTFSEHARHQMLRALVAVRHKMSVQMAALLVAHVGTLPDGNATRRLPWVNTQTNVAQPAGLDEIDRNFYDVGVPAEGAFIIGGQPVWQWEKSVNRGGLDAQGQYINQTRTNNMYYDNLINTTFNNGTENVLAFDPEMIKFISFNEHAGLFRTREYSIEDIDQMFAFGSPERIEGTMPDPVTGLLWDLDVYYDHKADDCRGAWKMQIKLQWDIFFMPPEICLNGYTGIFHYTTCPQLEVVCPTGSVIAPGTEDTFSASASGISYPFVLNELTIAGQTSNPSINSPVSIANIAQLVAQMNAMGVAGYTFAVDGTNIEYDGYTGTTVLINGGTGNTDGYTLTFTA